MLWSIRVWSRSRISIVNRISVAEFTHMINKSRLVFWTRILFTAPEFSWKINNGNETEVIRLDWLKKDSNVFKKKLFFCQDATRAVRIITNGFRQAFKEWCAALTVLDGFKLCCFPLVSDQVFLAHTVNHWITESLTPIQIKTTNSPALDYTSHECVMSL